MTSKKIMSQMNVTWTKGAVPPRFGYFVEGQSNAVGRPVGDITLKFIIESDTTIVAPFVFAYILG